MGGAGDKPRNKQLYTSVIQNTACTHMRTMNGHGKTPGFGVSWKERSVCVVEIQAHAPASIGKYQTPISQHAWFAVWIEEPSGVVETQVHSLGAPEKISTYILPPLYTHTRVYTRPFRHIVCTPLVAGENIACEMHQQHEKNTEPACGNMQWLSRVVTPDPGRQSEGGNTQAAESAQIRNAIAFEDPTHSRSDGAKATIEIHISILVCRGRLLPLG